MKLKSINPKLFWRSLAGRACGVTIVTSSKNNNPAGFLALSVTHLTSDPPIITISIGKSTSAIKTVISSNSLAVNYIRKSDLELADIFSGKTDLKGSDRFDDKRWDILSTGSPILKDAVSVLDCCIEETIERYDTFLILAKIVNFTDNEFLDPMIHFRGKFANQ